MQCPKCHAESPEDATNCGQCGLPFPSGDLTQSLMAASALPTASHSVGGSRISRVSAASLALEPGSEFGPRYRIDSLIGEGGMGTVYKAHDNALDRTVALKLVRPELTNDPHSMQRFKQELLLASKISHKNILRIHDLGEVEGVTFISMAYVEGEDLHHALKKAGRLPLDRAVRIARQLCGALDAAEAEGVVHRDMKPQNVLMDQTDTVYITDFGLAKSLEAEASTMTRTGQILGTPRYMAPEQVEASAVDHRTDIYALGLIIYEMVTGDIPFGGDSSLQVMYQRVTQRPKNPKLLNPDLPDHLVRIIMRCLEKDPALRYQHARDILADLEAGRAPERSLAASISRLLPAPTPHRRSWLMGAGVALLAVFLVVAAVFVRNWFLHRSEGGRAAAPALKRLAVLPFRPLGDAESLKYQSEGMTEALSAKLFQLKSLHLASPAAAERVNRNDPLEKIARGLGVTLVVQGTMQGSDERVKVVISLDDVQARRRLWTEEFSGLPQDLLTIEDQIYNKLVTVLDLKLTNEELTRGTARPTEDIGAYELYLKGRNVMRGQRDPKSLTKSLDLFDQAIKKDARFALAYAGAADASLAMYDLTKENVWPEKALGAAHQAQRLNDNLPEVHFSLGSSYMATGKTAEAIAELKRALELAPNSDEGYRRLGNAYLAGARQEEAVQAYQDAIRINPYYWVNHNQLGVAYLRFGNNQKSEEAFRHVTELEPDRASGYANLGVVYFRQGKWNECVPVFQKSIELQPSFRGYSNLGTAYFYSGRYSEAAKMFEKAVEMSPNEQLAVGNLADAYRWLGQKEKANATYDRAIALALKALQVNPRDAGTLGSLALYNAKKDKASTALDLIRRARSVDKNDNALIYKEAVIHASAGEQAEALQGLREALEKGYSLEEAKSDPELQKLRATPEFQKLLDDVKRAATSARK